MKNHPSLLAARVAAMNAAHAEVNRLAPIYRAIFAEYIGQKVTKADGSLLAKIKARLPESSLQVYSPHVGCFVVKTSASYGDHFCTYAEPYFYAFTENRHAGHICEKLGHEFEPFRADYTAEEVCQLRKTAEEAREAARNAESACSPFGLYDN